MPPSKRQFCLVVRAIFAMIHLRTLKRSGVLKELLLENFQNRHLNNTGDYIVEVRKHKTSTTHGKACIPLTPSQVQWIDIYIRKIRCYVTKEECEEYVFLKFAGKKYNSGEVSREFSLAFVAGLAAIQHYIYIKYNIIKS